MLATSKISSGSPPTSPNSGTPQTYVEKGNYKIHIDTGWRNYYTRRDELVWRAPNSSLARHTFPKNWTEGKKPDEDGFYKKRLESVDHDGFDQVYKWCLYGTISNKIPDIQRIYMRRVADQYNITPCLTFIDEILPLSKAAAQSETSEAYFTLASKLAEMFDILALDDDTIDRELQKGLSLEPPNEQAHQLENFIVNKKIPSLSLKFLELASKVIADVDLYAEISDSFELFEGDRCGVVLRQIRRTYAEKMPSGSLCSLNYDADLEAEIGSRIEKLVVTILDFPLPIEELDYLRKILFRSNEPIITQISEKICQKRGNDEDWITHAVLLRLSSSGGIINRPMLTALKHVKNVQDLKTRQQLLSHYKNTMITSVSKFPNEVEKIERIAEIMHVLKINFAEFTSKLWLKIAPDVERQLSLCGILENDIIPRWRALILEDLPEDAASQEACTTFERETRAFIANHTP